MPRGRYLMSAALLRQLLYLPEDVAVVSIQPAPSEDSHLPEGESLWVEVEGKDVPEGVVDPVITRIEPLDGSTPTFVWDWRTVGPNQISQE